MKNEELLQCLVQVVGRFAMPADRLRAVVGTGKNRVKAFNLCDGTHTVSEIARSSKINQGNLSRSIALWVQHGIVFWMGSGKEARVFHIYPIPLKESPSPKGSKTK